MIEKKISLHLNSKRSSIFEGLINSILSTVNDINIVEIIVHIDRGDNEMIQSIKNFDQKYPDLIKYFETDLIRSFADAWIPLNLMLNKMSDSVALVSCISDDLRFITKNWDKILLSYENKFEDNIYRLRCSKFKKQQYNDLWQCGYAPDSYAFYSKNWITNVGIWCPCIGPDSYHECISYYMSKISNKYNRNIIVNDMSYEGESVSTDITLEERISRARIYYKAFNILMSYQIQKKALEHAKKLIKNIDKNDANILAKKFEIRMFEHNMRNLYRRFDFFKYRGSSDHPVRGVFFNIIFIIWYKIKILDFLLIYFIRYSYERGILKKIIKNKNQYDNLESIIKNES